MTTTQCQCIRDRARECLKALGMDLNETPSVEEPKRPSKKRISHRPVKDRWYRTKMLAMPIRRPQPRPVSPPAVAREKVGRISSRLEYLSRPKKDHSEDPCAYPPTAPDVPSRDRDKFNKEYKISERLLRLSRPRPEIPEEIPKRSRFSVEKWAAYQTKLRTFARHRTEPHSPSEPVRKKVALETILPRLIELSKPPNRPANDNERTDEEMFTVNPAALKYVASDRIMRLSTPKTYREPLENVNYDPRQRLLRSKKYIASDRIKELSKPMYRPTPKEEEVKVGAFEVSRKALKARLSPRLKRLATPIKRD